MLLMWDDDHMLIMLLSTWKAQDIPYVLLQFIINCNQQMLLLTHSCRHFLEISIWLGYWMKRKFFLWERMSMLLAYAVIVMELLKLSHAKSCHVFLVRLQLILMMLQMLMYLLFSMMGDDDLMLIMPLSTWKAQDIPNPLRQFITNCNQQMLLLTHSCRHFLEISIRLEYWMKRKFFLWERMSMLLAYAI
ncbi:hypothetical protein QN277_024012 [Acacia crassicarpa]|uniref:Uncharacterized protein n=1 Tax=Acacia crassicarpa TaxID=499986 RepID=A0AAE1JCS4_9FABA|nr:hypothetical protein QN277_024012 [Acacia crassicarpa]